MKIDHKQALANGLNLNEINKTFVNGMGGTMSMTLLTGVELKVILQGDAPFRSETRRFYIMVIRNKSKSNGSF